MINSLHEQSPSFEENRIWIYCNSDCLSRHERGNNVSYIILRHQASYFMR
jgi:hypothetical protein